jgi:hypothetical protein
MESNPVTQASDAFEPLAAVVREYHGMAQALLDLFRRRAGLVEDVYAAQVCCIIAGRWKRAKNICFCCVKYFGLNWAYD